MECNSPSGYAEAFFGRKLRLHIGIKNTEIGRYRQNPSILTIETGTKPVPQHGIANQPILLKSRVVERDRTLWAVSWDEMGAPGSEISSLFKWELSIEIPRAIVPGSSYRACGSAT